MSSNTGLTSIGGVGVGVGLGIGFICGFYYRSIFVKQKTFNTRVQKMCDGNDEVCMATPSDKVKSLGTITNIDFQYKYYELQNKYLNECEDLRIKNIVLDEQVQLFKNRNRALCKLINRQRNKGLMLGCSSIGIVKGFVIGRGEVACGGGAIVGIGAGSDAYARFDADYAIVRIASAEC